MQQFRRLSIAIFVACLGAWWVDAAEYSSPVAIGTDLGVVEDAAIAIDRAGNPCVVFAASQQIYFASGFDSFATARLVGSTSTSAAQDHPAVDTDGAGVTYVAFREKDPSDVQEVVWTNNLGGMFKEPLSVPESTNAGIEQPTITVTPSGGVVIGWSVDKDLGAGDGEIFMFSSRLAEAPSRILNGREAAFAVDGNGVTHVAYIRDGDLYCSNNKAGTFEANEVRFTNSVAREFSPKIVTTSNGTAIVMYLSENNGATALYLSDGTFRELLVAETNVPRFCALAIDAQNVYNAAFAASGAVWTQRGVVGVMRQRSKVCDLAGNEELIDVAVDGFAYVHLALVRGGALSYINNAPKPNASFEMSATEGMVPFEVQFMDTSTGHVLYRRWDFGDGQTSLDPQPLHKYEVQGTYTVTLRVTGTAGVTSEVVKAQAVKVLPKDDHMYMPDAYIYAGQQDVKVAVKVTNVLPFQGFQVAGRFNPAVISLEPGDKFIDFESTVSKPLAPEFVAGAQNPEEGWFTMGVIFGTSQATAGKAVRPGRKMNVVNLVVDVKNNVPNRSDAGLRLMDDVGDPVIRNILTVQGGVSVSPELHNGKVIVIRPDLEFLGPLFLRGDTTADRSINIGDSIFVLSYLFARGKPPACMDSADVDDNGQVNIADAVAILSYLFGGSFTPAFPFPNAGLDGTQDGLPACK